MGSLPSCSRSDNVHVHSSGVISRSAPPSPWGGRRPGIVGYILFGPVQVVIA